MTDDFYDLVKQLLSKVTISEDNELSVETSQGMLAAKFDYPISMEDVENAARYFHRMTLQNILNGLRHSFDELVIRIEDSELTMMDASSYRELVYKRIYNYIRENNIRVLDCKNKLISSDLLCVLRVTNSTTTICEHRLIVVKLTDEHTAFTPTYIFSIRGWENRSDDFVPTVLVKTNPLGL